MRRGRPAAAPAPAAAVSASRPKPAPSPMRVATGDPFAALDGKATSPRSADELSSRFPTLDQFSILHDQGAHFSFDDSALPGSGLPPDLQKPGEPNQRADDAFAASTAKATPQAVAAAATASIAATGKLPSSISGVGKAPVDLPYSANRLPRGTDASPERRAAASASPRNVLEMSRASAIISSTPELQAISAQRQQTSAAPAPAPKPKMVSTGTMTSPSPTPPPQLASDSSGRPQIYQVYRFPTSSDDQPIRSSSLPRKQFAEPTASSANEYAATPPPLTRSQPLMPSHVRHPSSSRPSLETTRPGLNSLDSAAPSLPTRPRPTSAFLDSNLDYLREREASGSITSSVSPGAGGRPLLPPINGSPKYGEYRVPSVSPRLDATSGNSSGRDEPPTTTDIDYLRSMEESDNGKRERSHLKQFIGGGSGSGSGGSTKRSSMNALSGTKSILAGRFGDAFKRFETTGSASSKEPPALPAKKLERQQSDYEPDFQQDPDSDRVLPEPTDDMSPEQRREIERRRLSLEEQRVAQAAAEYRQRIARRDTGPGRSASPVDTGMGSAPLPKSIGGVSRAVSIQNRVQNLLSEAQSTTPVTRTAQGYGHFTDDGSGAPAPGQPSSASSFASPLVGARGSFDERPDVRRKPVVGGPGPMRSVTPLSLSDSASSAQRVPPTAKPKPTHLNKPLPIPRNENTGSSHISLARPGSPTMQPPPRPVNASAGRGKGASVLMAEDLPGQPVLEDMTLQDRDDYIRDFARRFPSLTAIEMVERDVPDER